MRQSVEVDWKALVFESGWLDRLDRLAAKRFGEGGLAEEATSYVLDKLSANNWSAFQSYKGQSKPQTYLHTLTSNFIEEFARKRFGRPRPPEWLKRQGELWIRVWKLLCLERRPPQSVIDLLCGQDLREPASIQTVMQTVKARIPWCGESAREIASNPLVDEDGETAMEDLIPEYCTPESRIETDHLRDTLQLLSCLLSSDINPARVENAAGKAQQAMQQAEVMRISQLGDVLDLSDEQWLILRMVYQDGMKLKAVAETLGMKVHEPGRIMKRILENIAEVLTGLGVNKENFHDLLKQ